MTFLSSAPLKFGLAAVVIALASTSHADNLKRIKKEADFRAMAVDQKYMSDKGDWILAASDGTLTGSFGGKDLTGAWNWQGKYWCRNARVGGKEIGSDCQEMHLSATQLRTKRQKGKGDWASVMTKQ